VILSQRNADTLHPLVNLKLASRPCAAPCSTVKHDAQCPNRNLGVDRVAVFAWAALVRLLLIAFDGIPDAEQFTGILVVGSLWIAGIEPSAGPRSTHKVAVSLSTPSAYLAFLFRSPPAATSPD